MLWRIGHLSEVTEEMLRTLLIVQKRIEVRLEEDGDGDGVHTLLKSQTFYQWALKLYED